MNLRGSSLLLLLIAYAASVHAAQTSEKSAVIRAPNSIRIAGEQLADLPVTVASALDGGLTRGEVSGQLSFPYSTVRNTLRRPPQLVRDTRSAPECEGLYLCECTPGTKDQRVCGHQGISIR